MIKPFKLLFDECLGKPLVDRINGLVSLESEPSTLAHLCDKFAPGTCDSIWLPKVAEEGWTIITSDRGKNGRVKLPDICLRLSITHVLLGPSVLHKKQGEKAILIVEAWRKMKDACMRAPSGTRFQLTSTEKGFRFAEVQKPLIEVACPAIESPLSS